MFELLSGYLDVTATPEQRTTCLQACKVLSDIGLSDHEFQINQELEISDQSSGDFLINLVEGILKPIYRNQLKEFGITLNEDTTLEQYVDVLNGVSKIDNYDDLATVYTYCDSSDGPVAALADILPLVGRYKSDDYLSFIDNVSEDLIDRIASLYEDTSEVDPIPEPITVARARIRFTRFLASPNTKLDPETIQPIAVQLLNNGGRLGLPFTVLLETYLATLAGFNAARLAIELVALGAISNLEDNELKPALSKVIDLLGLELSTVTAADISVNKLLPQVFHEQT